MASPSGSRRRDIRLEKVSHCDGSKEIAHRRQSQQKLRMLLQWRGAPAPRLGGATAEGMALANQAAHMAHLRPLQTKPCFDIFEFKSKFPGAPRAGGHRVVLGYFTKIVMLPGGARNAHQTVVWGARRIASGQIALAMEGRGPSTPQNLETPRA
jgi:hypothetical protein